MNPFAPDRSVASSFVGVPHAQTIDYRRCSRARCDHGARTHWHSRMFIFDGDGAAVAFGSVGAFLVHDSNADICPNAFGRNLRLQILDGSIA